MTPQQKDMLVLIGREMHLDLVGRIENQSAYEALRLLAVRMSTGVKCKELPDCKIGVTIAAFSVHNGFHGSTLFRGEGASADTAARDFLLQAAQSLLDFSETNRGLNRSPEPNIGFVVTTKTDLRYYNVATSHGLALETAPDIRDKQTTANRPASLPVASP